MTKAEFIDELASLLSVDAEELRPDAELKQFKNWDSTAVLTLIALLDEQGIDVEEASIPDCQTVQDVLNLAGPELR